MTVEGGLWLRDGGKALSCEDINVSFAINEDDDIDEGGWNRMDDWDEFSSSKS